MKIDVSGWYWDDVGALVRHLMEARRDFVFEGTINEDSTYSVSLIFT